MALQQSKDGPVFQSANIKNIDTLAALTANYVRALIGVTEESQSFECSTAASHEVPLSSDEEVKQLRAEMDFIDTQLKQYLQYTEILRRASESIRGIRYKHEDRRRDVRRKLKAMMATRTTKLPRLPGEILSMICEAYGRRKRNPVGPTNRRNLCDIICGGAHGTIVIPISNMSPQSFQNIILHGGKAQLDVFISGGFSDYRRSQMSRTMQDAIQFGDRWRVLSIKEYTMEAVKSVLHHCQSVLSHVRRLDIGGKFVEKPTEWKSWPNLPSTTSQTPCLRTAKVPLGCIAKSRWLFQHLISLCVHLPEKLDKPEDLVDCLKDLPRLTRLTLRSSAKLDLKSYQTKEVASLPSLKELEFMFGELDIDILMCMLNSLSCQNVWRFIGHFDPLFKHCQTSTEDDTDTTEEGDSDSEEEMEEASESDEIDESEEDESDSNFIGDKKPRDFVLNLWSFLDERLPALEDITLGSHHMARYHGHTITAWNEEFMSILAEPTDVGRWLFSRLSSLTFHVGMGENDQHAKCSTILRLAVARAQQDNVSDVNSVRVYGLSDVEVELENSEFDALRFYIPNLYINWTDKLSSQTEGWLFR
ncbi:hypothetical protein BD410DRAFT_831798 [Rickenella mellea]|uniref:Uncharacterized protein n=1 Tax=Rickenella mellea TaxID=50990 RepID=A0A4Y7PP30_9AGAM|nr:hypothetical protein BD410DRAFT_831798 [Rickenella mellea]